MQKLVTVSHTVCSHVEARSQEVFGTLVPRPLSTAERTWLTHRNMCVLHLSYHAELDRFSSNRMRVNNLVGAGHRPLNCGACLTSKKRLFIHMCHDGKFDCFRSNGWCEITLILTKSFTLASRLSRTRGASARGVLGAVPPSTHSAPPDEYAKYMIMKMCCNHTAF